VTGRSCSALALIIDHDLGFVMWLGELFAELGCQAVPALNCRQALALAKRLNLSITILAVNLELRGARRMVQLLVAANPGVRIVLIRDSADPWNAIRPNASGIQARFTLERPSPGETISRPEWVAKIRKILSLAAGK
jgi:hypothetical protein